MYTTLSENAFNSLLQTDRSSVNKTLQSKTNNRSSVDIPPSKPNSTPTVNTLQRYSADTSQSKPNSTPTVNTPRSKQNNRSSADTSQSKQNNTPTVNTLQTMYSADIPPNSTPTTEITRKTSSADIPRNTPAINSSGADNVKDMHVKFENFNKTIDEFEKLRESLFEFLKKYEQKAKIDKSFVPYAEQTALVIKSIDTAISKLRDERYKHLVNMAQIK
jgi:hypothetical protein